MKECKLLIDFMERCGFGTANACVKAVSNLPLPPYGLPTSSGGTNIYEMNYWSQYLLTLIPWNGAGWSIYLTCYAVIS